MTDKSEQIIKDIQMGDKTALERYSRWEIYNLFNAGKISLMDVPLNIYNDFINLIDDCKISL